MQRNPQAAPAKPKGKISLQDIVPIPERENNEYQRYSYERLEGIQDQESTFERGHRLANGFGVTKDVDRGWKLILEAAREGHPVALALCFTAGVETTRDDKRAVGLLKESAQRGHAVAQFNLGVCYIQGVGIDRNFSEAARYFKLAADSSFTAAQFNLGNCYGSGIGVSRDYALAAFYFKLAADAGRQDARSALTIALGRYADELKPELLRCITRNIPWAGKDLDVSDENGKVVAYARLFYGIGVNRDEAAAKRFLFDAALQRQPVALSVCLIEGIEFESNEKNKRLAASLLQAFSRNAEASFHLGLCFQKGIGVQADAKKAFDLFKISAEQGNIPALFCLAHALENGIGTEPNLPLAIEKYNQAAEKGYADALYKLADFYFKGLGVTQSFENYLKHLEKAANIGHPEAIGELKKIRENQTIQAQAQQAQESAATQPVEPQPLAPPNPKTNKTNTALIQPNTGDKIPAHTDLEKAQALYQQARHLDKKDTLSQKNLSKNLLTLAKSQENAFQVLEQEKVDLSEKIQQHQNELNKALSRLSKNLTAEAASQAQAEIIKKSEDIKAWTDHIECLTEKQSRIDAVKESIASTMTLLMPEQSTFKKNVKMIKEHIRQENLALAKKLLNTVRETLGMEDKEEDEKLSKLDGKLEKLKSKQALAEIQKMRFFSHQQPQDLDALSKQEHEEEQRKSAYSH